MGPTYKGGEGRRREEKGGMRGERERPPTTLSGYATDHGHRERKTKQ